MGINAGKAVEFLSAPVFDMRPEKLSVEDFISLPLLFGEL